MWVLLPFDGEIKMYIREQGTSVTNKLILSHSGIDLS